jgi:hypothetical protein
VQLQPGRPVRGLTWTKVESWKYSFSTEAKLRSTSSSPIARPELRRTPQGSCGPVYPGDPARPKALYVSPTRPVNASRESSR